MVEEGYQFKDIASLLNFNPNVLRRVLKRYGIDISEINKRKPFELYGQLCTCKKWGTLAHRNAYKSL